MTPCDDDDRDNSQTWCCDGSKACCGTKNAITLDADIFTKPTTTTSNTSATSSSTSTTSPSDTPTASNPQSSSGLSTGGKAGIGVGVAVGASIIIVAISWFFVRRYRRNKNTEPGIHAPSAPWIRSLIPQELGSNHIYEKSARKEDTVYELPGGTVLR